MFTVKNNFNLQQESSTIIIGLFKDGKKFTENFNELDEKFNKRLSHLINSGEISAEGKTITPLFTFGQIAAERIIFVGLGEEAKLSSDLISESFGKLFKYASSQSLTSLAIDLQSFVANSLTASKVASLASEALPLSTYKVVDYKTSKVNKCEKKIDQLIAIIETEDEEEILNGLKTGYIYGKAVNSARSLVNLPGNMLTATELANYAEQVAAKYNFEIDILSRNEMEELRMGAMLAVNDGSAEEAKMIVLKHRGQPKWENVISLVGKGITFDTGGYSLKPKDGIVGMKTDMGGAAAVLAAMEIIGELNVEQNVLAVIPATDNMISGKALKPDDVIKSLSGKTIEVLNTDAEGRLVLADAVTYAKQCGANYLVDVATLTGGVIVALGNDITGALTNNEQLYRQVSEAANECNEPIWQLPLFEKDKERVRNSKIADLNNSPGREGHAIMGGAFIGEFAGETPWVHLDIAGTATTNSSHDLGPAGATGVMAKTLAKFVTNFKQF